MFDSISVDDEMGEMVLYRLMCNRSKGPLFVISLVLVNQSLFNSRLQSLDDISGIVTKRRHFLIFSTMTTSSVRFPLLFDEMISSKVQGNENANHYGKNNPDNFISGKGLANFVCNVSGHGRGFLDCQFAMVPFPAFWAFTAVMFYG